MSSEFKTKTHEEYMKRVHALTIKVLAGAFLTLIIVVSMFAGALCYMANEQTKQIKSVFEAQVEIESSVERGVTQGAITHGNDSPVNQAASK